MDVKHTAAAVVQQESVQLLQLRQIVPKITVKHFVTGRIKLGNNAVKRRMNELLNKLYYYFIRN